MADTATPKVKCMVLACFGLVGAAILIPASLSTIGLDHDLALRGRHIQAAVQYGTTRMTSGAGNALSDRSEYLLLVSYSVNGEAYGQKLCVDRATYLTHEYGTSVDVVYDPEDPNRAKWASAPTGQGATGLTFGFIFLAAAIVLPIVGLRWKPPEPVPDLDEALSRARRGV